jgi:phosphonatase-like hydrolase
MLDFSRGLHQAAARGSATGPHHVQCPHMDTTAREGWRALAELLASSGERSRSTASSKARVTLFQLAVFDVAGTTVFDGDIVIDAIDEALGLTGLRVDRDAIRALMGVPKPMAIRTLLERHHADASNETVGQVHEDFLARVLDRYRCAPVVREMDGASALFAALHERGIKVALDTGFSRPILDVLLHRLGWTTPGAIDCSVTSDEVARGRPAADLIWRAMQLTGVVDPRAVVKVGDTPADIESGHAAACGCVVGVAYGTHSRAELEQYRPTAVIDRLSGLIPLVEAGSDLTSN